MLGKNMIRGHVEILGNKQANKLVNNETYTLPNGIFSRIAGRKKRKIKRSEDSFQIKCWRVQLSYILKKNIYNWSLQPFIWGFDLVLSCLCDVACIIYVSGGAYSLMSSPSDRFFLFEKIFFNIFLFTLKDLI